jgi:hypothetical protein
MIILSFPELLLSFQHQAKKVSLEPSFCVMPWLSVNTEWSGLHESAGRGVP